MRGSLSPAVAWSKGQCQIWALVYICLLQANTSRGRRDWDTIDRLRFCGTDEAVAWIADVCWCLRGRRLVESSENFAQVDQSAKILNKLQKAGAAPAWRDSATLCWHESARAERLATDSAGGTCQEE